MFRIKFEGNFFLILNQGDLSEVTRHPLSDTTFQPYNEDLPNPDISFFALVGNLNSKNSESTSYKFDDLIDDSTGVAFVSFDALKTILSDNLGKSSPESGAGLTNVIDIITVSDLPPAIGGIRELVQEEGIPITYRFGADKFDVGSDKFKATGADVVFIGLHRSETTIISSTTGTFITCVDAGFFPEFIGFDCPNAKVIDFSVPTSTFKSLVLDNVIIRDCTSIATIDGAFTTSLRTLTIATTQTNGFLWTGTDNFQINISNNLAFSWTGTLFDLGTATFDIIDISGGNRFISPSGTQILRGVTNSANLTATGRGLVRNNLFNGTGTALDILNTMDLKWQYSGNTFADGFTLNSRQIADVFITVTETVSISTQGVYVAIGGSNWSTDISDRFTVSTSGLMTYIGLQTIEIQATSISTIELSSGGSAKICTKIAINGVVSDKTMGCTQNNTPSGVSSSGLFTITTGDTIQTFVGNEDSSSNIDVSESNLIVKGA